MDGQGEAREMSQEEKKKYMVGQCNYLLLMFISFAAFILSQNSTWYCAFAEREIKYNDGYDVNAACAEFYPNSSVDQGVCTSLFGKSGIGFYYWLATVPVDQKVCMGYTMWIPDVGYVTPSFDAAFNAGKVFAVMAAIFGAFGWFSVIFATCCPVSQDRIAGLSCYFTLATICQSFSFLIYASDICEKGWIKQYFKGAKDELIDSAVESVTCGLHDGAKMSITAAVLYLVCSSLAPMSRAPAPVRMGRYSEAPANEGTPAPAETEP